jgi:hypothetical protein
LPEPTTPPPSNDQADAQLQLEGVVLAASRLSTSPMLPYAQLLVKLIDGFELSSRELVEVLQRAVRQRSLASRNRLGYVLNYLHEHPP